MKILIALMLTAMTLLSSALAQQPSKNPVTQNAQTKAGDSPSTRQVATRPDATAAEDKVYRVKVEAVPPDKPQPPSIWAISAVLISVLSLGTSVYFSRAAREHNRRSVRPLPYIRQPDYENHMAVLIQNNGTGPLILHSAQATRADGASDHIIDLIPAPPPGKFFKNFNRIQQARAIRPGDEVVLLDIDINTKNPVEVKYRDDLRQILGEMRLTLEYTDIYETRFRPYSLTMDWFARHLKAGARGARP